VLTSLAGVNQEGNQALVSDAALPSDGDTVASGSFGLVRYLPGGKLDTSFGIGGFAQTGFGASALAIEPNGEYLVAGHSGNDFAVARQTTSGTLDRAFGNDGVVLIAFPAAADDAGADAVLVEPDGKILAGGEASVPGTTRNEPVVEEGVLALYNPNGTLDTAFGSDGIVRSTATIGNLTALGTDASGNIFVLPARAEFSAAGQLDASITPETIVASSQGGDSTFLSTGQPVTARACRVDLGGWLGVDHSGG
jgi:uncharacterized delta-60 repeat protein